MSDIADTTQGDTAKAGAQAEVEKRFGIPTGEFNDGRTFRVALNPDSTALTWDVHTADGILWGSLEYWTDGPRDGLALYAANGAALRGCCTHFRDSIYYLDMYYDSALLWGGPDS
jgi:hypothetical protein